MNNEMYVFMSSLYGIRMPKQNGIGILKKIFHIYYSPEMEVVFRHLSL